MMVVGGVLGGIGIGPASDKYGRRMGMGLTTIPLMVR